MIENEKLINEKISDAREICVDVILLLDMLKNYTNLDKNETKEMAIVEIFSEILSAKCKTVKDELNEIELDFHHYCEYVEPSA